MKMKDWVYGGPCEVSIWVRLNTGYMPPFLATSIRNMIIFDQLFSHMSDSVPHLQVGLWTHLPSSIYLAQTSINSAVDLYSYTLSYPLKNASKIFQKTVVGGADLPEIHPHGTNPFPANASKPTKPTTFSNKMAAGGTSILRRVRQKSHALRELTGFWLALINGP